LVLLVAAAMVSADNGPGEKGGNDDHKNSVGGYARRPTSTASPSQANHPTSTEGSQAVNRHSSTQGYGSSSTRDYGNGRVQDSPGASSQGHQSSTQGYGSSSASTRDYGNGRGRTDNDTVAVSVSGYASSTTRDYGSGRGSSSRQPRGLPNRKANRNYQKIDEDYSPSNHSSQQNSSYEDPSSKLIRGTGYYPSTTEDYGNGRQTFSIAGTGYYPSTTEDNGNGRQTHSSSQGYGSSTRDYGNGRQQAAQNPQDQQNSGYSQSTPQPSSQGYEATSASSKKPVGGYQRRPTPAQ